MPILHTVSGRFTRGECWSTCSRGAGVSVALSTGPDQVSVSTHSTLTIWVLSGEHDTQKKLRFTRVAWSAKEAEGLAAALPRFQNLKVLYLYENNLDDEAAKSLAQSLTAPVS